MVMSFTMALMPAVMAAVPRIAGAFGIMTMASAA